MELGTLIGIILTILVAVVSSRSGKKPKVHSFPPEQDNEPQYDFPPYTMHDYDDETASEAYSLETIPDNQYNLESYRPDLPSMETDYSKPLPNHKHQPIQNQETIDDDDTGSEKFDFDLRNAVIYSEILNPRFKQY